MEITQQTADNLPEQLKQSVGSSKKCVEFINTFMACESNPDIHVNKNEVLKMAATLNKLYFTYPKSGTLSALEQTSKVLSLIINYCGSFDKRVNLNLLRQENQKIYIMKAYQNTRVRD